MSRFHYSKARQVLRQGGIIAYPTDTISGLGALAVFEDTLVNLIRLKKRDFNKGLILLGTELSQFIDFVDPNELVQLNDFLKNQKTQTQHNLNDFRPTTYLVLSNPKLPKNIKQLIAGGYEKIAIRITDNLKIKLLLEGINLPIVSSSLNLSGNKTLYKNYQLKKFFSTLDYVVPLNSECKTHSRIVDFQTGKIIRA